MCLIDATARPVNSASWVCVWCVFQGRGADSVHACYLSSSTTTHQASGNWGRNQDDAAVLVSWQPMMCGPLRRKQSVGVCWLSALCCVVVYGRLYERSAQALLADSLSVWLPACLPDQKEKLLDAVCISPARARLLLQAHLIRNWLASRAAFARTLLVQTVQAVWSVRPGGRQAYMGVRSSTAQHSTPWPPCS